MSDFEDDEAGSADTMVVHGLSEKALLATGIRIGTPALTTRGMKEGEMRQIGRWIAEALYHRTDAAVLAKVRKQVLGMCETFPLYAERRAKAQAEVRA